MNAIEGRIAPRRSYVHGGTMDRDNRIPSPGYLATQKGYKTRFFSVADLVLMLEAAQRQGRYR